MKTKLRRWKTWLREGALGVGKVTAHKRGKRRGIKWYLGSGEGEGEKTSKRVPQWERGAE